MSLPNVDREMLLSAALDGELSAQEQAEFDRAISTDPTFASEFEELQWLRADLRRSLAPVRSQRLPAGATDRIVNAALTAPAEAAATEVLPANVATRPSSTRIAGKIAAAFALAAAMLLTVTLWNRISVDMPLAVVDAPAPERLDSVAQGPGLQSDRQPSDRQPSEPLQMPVEQPPTVASTSKRPAGDARDTGSADLQSIAASGAAASGQTDDSRPKVMSIKPSPMIAPSTQAIASTDHGSSGDLAAASNPVTSGRQPLQVVLVLAVELTQAGRDQLALQEALRATDIRLGQGSVMGTNVVSHLQQANVIDAGAGDAPSGKLYFIEASAKRIDRLMTHLMSNRDLFAAVGLSLADQPPLLAAVSDLREIDPTKVRHQGATGVARDLVAPGGTSLSVNPNHAFLPLSRELVSSGLLPSTAPAPANGSANVIDDFPSQLLLFVK